MVHNEYHSAPITPAHYLVHKPRDSLCTRSPTQYSLRSTGRFSTHPTCRTILSRVTYHYQTNTLWTAIASVRTGCGTVEIGPVSRLALPMRLGRFYLHICYPRLWHVVLASVIERPIVYASGRASICAQLVSCGARCNPFGAALSSRSR